MESQFPNQNCKHRKIVWWFLEFFHSQNLLKGQDISEDYSIPPKIFFPISALASKKGANQKNKTTL